MVLTRPFPGEASLRGQGYQHPRFGFPAAYVVLDTVLFHVAVDDATAVIPNILVS